MSPPLEEALTALVEIRIEVATIGGEVAQVAAGVSDLGERLAGKAHVAAERVMALGLRDHLLVIATSLRAIGPADAASGGTEGAGPGAAGEEGPPV